MTTFYIDHGCTLYPTAYMTVPSSSASLPQEGDGLASGLGTAPAVASATMDFTGVTAAAGATYAVHGASLTCVASGANTLQFNAGIGAILALNLATAINAATSLPTTTTGGISPYLRAIVWASASGAVLTVYTRIASSLLNTASNASATLVCGTLGNWTSAPANSSFTGGVSGPWSIFFNAGALVNSVSATASAAGSYGGVMATTMGQPAGGDLVHVRTGRSSANIQVTGIGGVSMSPITRAVGLATAYLEYRFDNATIWPGAANNGIFELVMDGTGQNPSITLGGYTYWRGQMQSGTMATAGGQPNFRLSATAVNNSGWTCNFQMPSSLGVRHSVVECMEVSETGSGSATVAGWVLSNLGPSNAADALRPTRLVNCRIGVARAAHAPFAVSNIVGLVIEAVDCHMAYGGATTYANAICNPVGISSPINIRMLRPKFSGGGGGHHTLIPLLSGMAVPCSLIVDDPIDMGQFLAGDSAASICGRVIGASGGPFAGPDLAFVQAVNGSDNQFLLDTARRLLEWRTAGFPTTGKSTFADGTPFSLRFSVPHTGLATGLVTAMAPQRGIKQVAVNTLGAGNRTLTHHILIDSSFGGSAYTPTDAAWWLTGTYIATDGSVQVFSTKGTGTNLTADTQTWSSLTFSPFAGASRSYSRWVITVALTAVKANSLVTAYLLCGTQPATMSEWCFIDPEFELA